MTAQYVIFNEGTKCVHGFVDHEGDGTPEMPGWQLAPMSPPVPHYPEGPTETSILTWEGRLVWVEQASLIDIKARKNIEINEARFAANQSYFEFNGKQIACDAVSMLDIQSANAEISLTRQMPATWPGGWKTVDNSYVAIPDVATWTLFVMAMVARGTAHFRHAQALKGLLLAATTPAQVADISWSTITGVEQ